MFAIKDVIKLLTRIFAKQNKRFPKGLEAVDIRIKAKKIHDIGKAENYKGAISEDQLKQFLAFEKQQAAPSYRVIPGDSPEGKIITDKITGKNVIPFPEGGVDKVPVTKQFTGESFSADDHIKFIKSKEPIESMKEANALIGRKNPSYKGRYKNITDDEAKQILKDTEDHIFQRDVVPDEFDPDYASGGLAHMLGEPTYSNGGEVKKKPFLEKIFGPTLESQWDTFTDDQKQYIRENHPDSVPEGQAQGGRIGAEGGGIAGMLGEPTYREPMLWGGTTRIRKAIEFIRNALRSRGIERSRTSKTFHVIPERDKRLGKIFGIEAPQKSSSALAESVVEKLKMDLKHIKQKQKIAEGIASTVHTAPGMEKTPKGYKDYIEKSLRGMFDKSSEIKDIEKNLGIMEIIQRNLSGRKLNAEGGRIGFKHGSDFPKEFPPGLEWMEDLLDEMEQDKWERDKFKDLEKWNPSDPTYHAQGGRIGFKQGSFDPGKRKFLKILGGLAALPVVGKFFKWAKPAAKAAKTLTSVPIKNIEGMPLWFKPLVAKIIKEGKDVTKGYATVEREIVHKSKLPNSNTDVLVTQNLDSGDVLVDIGLGKHGWRDGRYGQPARLEYKAAEDIMSGPKDEPFKVGERDPLLRVKTSVHEDLVGSGLKGDPKSLHLKPGKTREEFWVDEAEFTGGHPENIKFEESVTSKYGEHASDFTEVEKFATGKVSKKSKSVGKGTEWEAEWDDSLPDDYASGGRVPLAGGGITKKLLQKVLAKLRNMETKLQRFKKPEDYIMDQGWKVGKYYKKNPDKGLSHATAVATGVLAARHLERKKKVSGGLAGMLGE